MNNQEYTRVDRDLLLEKNTYSLIHSGWDIRDAIFEMIFSNTFSYKNVWIFIEIPLKFVHKDPINIIPA